MLATWYIGGGLCILLTLILLVRRKTKIKLNGSHVLITGGSEGIGFSTAIKLAEKGANVSLLARTDSKLQVAATKLRESMKESQRVITVSCDISSSFESVRDAIDKVCQELGPVDVLVNCAGTSVAAAFEDTAIDDFERLMSVNYFGSVYATQAVISSMKSRKKGAIVFTSSQAGQVGIYGYTAYSASKFALRGLAECLRMEVKPYGVNVSMVFPPDTDTPGYKEEIKRSVPEETLIISKSSGLYSSETIANNIVKGILYGDFFIPVGLEGTLVMIMTAGMAPVASLIDGIVQVLSLSLLRISSLFYQYNFDSIVYDCMKKKCAGKKHK